MSSKVESHFSEAHFDMISRFSNFWSCPYGVAIWQSHMAKPYGSRGRGCRRSRSYCSRLKHDFFFFSFFPWKIARLKCRNHIFTKSILVAIISQPSHPPPSCSEAYLSFLFLAGLAENLLTSTRRRRLKSFDSTRFGVWLHMLTKKRSQIRVFWASPIVLFRPIYRKFTLGPSPWIVT